MVRLFAASVAVAATALAIGGTAPAMALPSSSGMASEFPVGTCMETQVGFTPTNYFINNFDLINVGAVSCSNPARRYRVIAQVQQKVDCDPSTQNTYITRDLVVLCVVQDSQPA